MQVANEAAALGPFRHLDVRVFRPGGEHFDVDVGLRLGEILLVGRHVVFRRGLKDEVDAGTDRLFAEHPLLGLRGRGHEETPRK